MNRSVHFLKIAGLAAAFSAGLAPPAAADSTPVLIGDSISAGRAGDLFLAERPAWDRDAVMGRLVNQLPLRLDERIANVGTPRRVVMALGTNTVAEWTKADFLDAVNKVPESTQVIFIAPYVRANDLDPALPRGSLANSRTHQYARWMNALAAEEPNVCVMPWRARVINDPALLRSDGAHPSWAGQRVWARMLHTQIGDPECQGFRAPLGMESKR